MTGTDVYADGKKVTISAKPISGHVFAGWYRDPELTKPMEFAVGDFRKSSQSVVVPEVRYLFARFIAATTVSDPIVGLTAKGEGLSGDRRFSWRVGVSVPEGDGIAFGSASLPSASAAKLPAGVKFDAARGLFTRYVQWSRVGKRRECYFPEWPRNDNGCGEWESQWQVALRWPHVDVERAVI